MHAALRKVCDSTQTSALYNVIHLLPDWPAPFHPWKLYGQLVAQMIEAGQERSNAVILAAQRLDDEWYGKTKQGRQNEPEKVRLALSAMVCLFKLFQAEDWACMAAYL